MNQQEKQRSFRDFAAAAPAAETLRWRGVLYHSDQERWPPRELLPSSANLPPRFDGLLLQGEETYGSPEVLIPAG